MSREPEFSYPLSSLQQGMLFHSLYAPGAGVEVIQILCDLHEDVDIPAFRRGWERVTERHEVLRTTFRWAGLQVPVQDVQREFGLSLMLEDWRELSPAQQEARRSAWLTADRRRGFDFSEEPLTRLALFRLAKADYQLVWTFHHMLVDGRGVALLLREVFAFYEAFRQGDDLQLPLPPQYRELVEWLGGQDLSAAEGYWRALLCGFTAPTPLPGDISMGAGWGKVTDEDYRQRHFSLSRETTAALEDMAHEHGFTMNTLVQGGWALLLGAYGGTRDVVFGATRACRHADFPRTEHIVGPLINTLPIRIRIPVTTSVADWLKDLRAQHLALREWEHTPLARIREWSDVPRGMPLFESIVVFENRTLTSVMRKHERQWENRELHVLRKPGNPLTVFGYHEPELRLTLNYDPSRFEPNAMDRLLRHFGRVLENMAHEPEQPVSQVGVLTEEEGQRLPGFSLQMRRDAREERTIHALFEAQAARTPGTIALVYDVERLTYEELDAQANRLAHHLRGRGVGQEVRVGLCLERSAEMVVAMLAVLKAGGAYVPLDPSHPAERLAYLVEDSGCVRVVTESQLAKLLPVGVAVTEIDREADEIAAQPSEPPCAPSDPAQVAYVLYTSGSTGRPKGVLVEHRSVASFLEMMRREPGMEVEDIMLAVTTLAFDIAVLELFLPLTVGARVVVADRGMAADPRLLAAGLERHGVTVLQATPSTWRMLVESRWPGRAGLRALCGGEALESKLAGRVRERVGSLWNLYGPTETTVWVTAEQVGEGSEPPPIGRPLANTTAYVLDDCGRLVPVGSPGELYLGGAQVARGYLGRPGHTAERFVPDPFSSERGARMYRTGDRVRWRPAERLEYLGRVDQQVKVRGFRIEPGEIEVALRAHPAVAEAHVLARTDADGETRLAAYFVPARSAPLSTAELHAFLRERLPDYMVPAAFVALERFPLTPNGKLDRRALPEARTLDFGTEYVAPLSPLERSLAGVWQEVLGVQRVGIDDNYFVLGGDSIRSIRLLALAHERGIELSLAQLYKYPTIRALAEIVEVSEGGEELAGPDEPFSLLPEHMRRVLPADAEDAFPSTMLQVGMLYLSERESASGMYHTVVVYHVETPFSAPALEEALRRLAAVHPALRSSFDLGSYALPVQIVHRECAVPLVVEDLRPLSPEHRDARLEQQFASEKAHRFDWRQPPLLRLRVHRIGEEKFQLLLTVHHAILDGWSVASLVTDLLRVYLALRDGAEASAAPARPGLSLGQYAALERAAVESAEHRAFWMRKLGDATVTRLPRADVAQDAAPDVLFHHVLLPEEVSRALPGVAAAAGVPLKSVLLAAHMRVLGVLGGAIDVVSGLIVNCRPERAGGDRLLGLLLNTVPLRLSLAGGTWKELMRAVFAAEEELLPFRRYPLAELQRVLARSPLFEAVFNFNHFHVYGDLADTPGFTFRLDRFFQQTEPPLTASFYADPATGRVELRLDFDRRALDLERVDRIGDYYTRALTALCREPEGRYDEVSLLSRGRAECLQPRTPTAPRDGGPQYVHEQFEARVRRTPAAVAVEHEGERLTYADLNARANRLAHHLRRLGVGPDVPVGVHLERTPEMVVAIIGVLKSGGAYVPVDASHPPERTAFAMRNSGAALLLTSSGLAAKLPPHDTPTLCLDAEEVEGDAASAPPLALQPDNLAFVIYTSGSTGRPKGVMSTHRALANHMRWWRNAMPFTPEDRLLQQSSIGFDASVWELLVPLLQGATLVLAPEGAERDPAMLVRVLAEQEITVLGLVPSLLRALLDEGLERCRTLRYLCSGGEVLPPQWAAEAKRQRPEAAVVNLYGPTETCIDALWHTFREQDASPTVPIGQSIANTQTYLLDDSLRPVPDGVVGELFLAGHGLARGYSRQPRMTADRFLPDPFSQEPGARMYRTGDLVRQRSDGSLEFVSRADFQVKIRGFRIELGEIEAVLQQHPGVAEVAVVVRGGASGDPRLVAYVAFVGTAPSADELRVHLRQRLPEYMLPSLFVTLEAFPRTSSGKLDRRALPEPVLGAREDTPVGSPRSVIVELLAGIWSEVLGTERIGIHDPFFEVGGHSLAAARMVSRARALFAVELPLAAVFEAPTIAGLASRVDALLRSRDEPRTVPSITAVLHDGPLPLSFAQQRLWFLDRLEPESSRYNLGDAVHLRGRLDVEALERALAEVVRRHESLRTTFSEVDGRPVQEVRPPAFSLSVADLSALLPGEKEAGARRRIRDLEARVFELERGPLFFAELLRLDEEDHVLAVVMHHIVSDAWSMGILYRELGVLYDAFSRGVRSPLPELPLQYADYAVWQRDHLQGKVLETQLKYWHEHLTGAPALLELPTDRPRSTALRYRGAGHSFTLPRELSERIMARARQEGVTLYMVLLSAFQLLLSRYSGQNDVVVGTSLANRPGEELERVIGFFVNTLALRTDFSDDPTFRELLCQVRELTVGALMHPDLPFERLVEELQPERSLSYTPVFQVFMALENTPAQVSRIGGLELTPFERDASGARFDLTLLLTETPAGIRGWVGYSADLFDASTIERMVGHYRNLLAALVEDPDQKVSTAPLLAPEERVQVLHRYNPDAEFEAEVCLQEWFTRQVTRSPDAVALVSGEECLTYAELDERANRLAWALYRRGVGPEARVGLCLERSPELVVAVLAVLKAGGAYVPVDPGYPTERISFLLRDSRSRLALTTDEFLEHLDGSACELLTLAALAAEDAPRTPPPVRVDPLNVAYVIYTSGSTGTPKGVAVTHANVARLFRATEPWFEFGPADVWTLFHSYAFDFSVWELWGALLYGGRLVLVPHWAARTPEILHRLLRTEGVTVLNQTPSAFRQLVQADSESAEPLATLRLVIFGGEALDLSTLAPWLDRYGPERPRLVNMYGITETTVHVTYRPLTAGDVGRPRSSPIGKPIPDLRLYVLDSHMQLTPLEVPGELYVGGAGLARGYLDRPGLTAERFVPDPFSGRLGARLYRSGDRVRRRADGELEYLGRVDQQVKVRGFRIEPGEIEVALRAHPAVAEAHVLARTDADGETRLAAYFVPARSAPLSTAELHAFLRERLPDYMVPAAFVALERFPLTPNGKLDRRALPEAAAAGAKGEGYVAPRDPVEEGLARIWADVLKVDGVGVHDNFFELGGHSLRATQVMSQVRKLFGVEVSLRTLFEGATIAQLAAEVQRARNCGACGPSAPLSRVPREDALPLSFAQQRLWFLSQFDPDSPLYNVPAAFRLRGRLDVRALEAALGGLVSRHEALRTVFALQDGEPVQVIARPEPWTLPVVGLEHLAEAEREAELRRRVGEEASRPFERMTGPLFRVQLLRLHDSDHALLWTAHHAVSDAWSTGILLRELGLLYRAALEGRPAPLPPLPLQYADYAVWQRQHLQGEVLETQLAYWRERLAGAPVLLELPTDRVRPAVRSPRGEAYEFRVPKALAAQVGSMAREREATVYMVLLAAFQVLLSRYSGQDDIVVGTPIAGRNRAELEALVGFFVNTLAIRADLSGNPRFAEFLAEVRNTTLGAYAHQELPFEKLVEELHPHRTLSYTPVFQVLFSLQNASDASLDLPGIEAEGMWEDNGTAKFDLTLHMQEDVDGVRGVFIFDATLFDRSTVERMAVHLTRVLEGAVADPDARILDLPLLGEGEWPRSEALSDRAERFEEPRCVMELFAEHVARQPDAPAVVFDDETLTYGELDQRSNQLARYLRSLGAGPEARVAICMERSPDALVALWGILKAGAAYVPLDPAYPRERLLLMLGDASAAVVLTHSRFATELSAPGTKVLCLDRDRKAIARERGDPLPPLAHPDNLAYIIYTSGSTGRPKGVQIQHRQLLNYLRGFTGRVGLGPGATFAMAQPLSVDFVVTHVFGSLCTGGCLHVLSEERSIDAEAMATYFRRQPIDCLKIVPSHLAALVSGPQGGDILPHRRLVLGGEGARPDWVRSLQAMRPGMEVFNHYGPTETTVGVIMHRVPPQGPAASTATLPLGDPLEGVTLYVLDARMNPLPFGVVGEIHVGGGCLARGYLNQPGSTAERFVPDPFSERPGARLYRTGDRARRLGDGTMEFLGRVDHQIKVRGFRVEPGEVEAALRALPGVREALAILTRDGPEPRLVAYAVSQDGVKLDGSTLRAALRARLPGHMVPSAVVPIHEVPRMPHGKIDLTALPAPHPAERKAGPVAPRTPEEQRLAELWSQLLGVREVGVHDDFFALGGHSLLAIRLISRVRQTFGAELPLRALFESPTVAGLATALERSAPASDFVPLSIPRLSRSGGAAGQTGSGPAHPDAPSLESI